MRRATGEAVLETFERAVAEAINQGAYDVVTAAAWLGALNAKLRADRGALSLAAKRQEGSCVRPRIPLQQTS